MGSRKILSLFLSHIVVGFFARPQKTVTLIPLDDSACAKS